MKEKKRKIQDIQDIPLFKCRLLFYLFLNTFMENGKYSSFNEMGWIETVFKLKKYILVFYCITLTRNIFIPVLQIPDRLHFTLILFHII